MSAWFRLDNEFHRTHHSGARVTVSSHGDGYRIKVTGYREEQRTHLWLLVADLPNATSVEAEDYADGLFDEFLAAIEPSPAPAEGTGDIWQELIDAEPDERIRRLLVIRRAVGLLRYGRPLQRDNGRDVARDLREELLDALAYAQQAGDVQTMTELRAILARKVGP